MRVIFRADASRDIGSGHVRRCIALAQALEQCDARISFAFRKGTLETVPELAPSSWRLVELSAGSADELGARSGSCDLLVLDSYGIGHGYERACRGFARRIAVIDDLANRSHDCDVLVDQTLGRAAADYAPLVPPHCRLLLGTRYAILGESYRHLRDRALQRRDTDAPGRVLVSFGAIDLHGMTERALCALGEIEERLEIAVALGVSSPNADRVAAMTRHFPHPVRLHFDLFGLAEEMTDADIAIGAGGTSSWERCCLGLPAVVVAVADNQIGNVNGVAEAGAAVCFLGPDEATSDAIGHAVRRLIVDGDARRAMARAAARLCDGWGCARIRAAVAPDVRARDGREVSLQPAEWQDRDLMLEWQSTPGVRSFARNPAVPSRQEHETWLKQKLDDPGCLFSVILHGGEPAGILRFDRRGGADVYEISILVAPQKQRCGIGLAALRLGRRLLPQAEIVACVHRDNVVSKRMFEAAGFVSRDEDCMVLAPIDLRHVAPSTHG